ncbi:MAG TPA: sigma-70 family RNA polymerase sigma factor [Steroidobacteraceae bacterium]|jgi:RNA polymerase sigma-70 factor (ECF subfamily)|nr:sigma-70 family RNA polymerase sigma factor [Steroidobacteraceae bacterium]
MSYSANTKVAMPARDDRLDRELLRSVANGDARALEHLYLEYHRRLLQFLSRLSSRREALEEAINDTFWIVWQKAKEFRGGSRVSTWIMGIAWRCAMKALRRNSDSSAEAFANSMPVETASAESLVVEERGEWLERGLATLPMEQRATLELAYYVGHSCEEIAIIMACPVNTVKARMFQARIKLRNLLPKLGGFHDTMISGGGQL